MGTQSGCHGSGPWCPQVSSHVEAQLDGPIWSVLGLQFCEIWGVRFETGCSPLRDTVWSLVGGGSPRVRWPVRRSEPSKHIESRGRGSWAGSRGFDDTSLLLTKKENRDKLGLVAGRRSSAAPLSIRKTAKRRQKGCRNATEKPSSGNSSWERPLL